MFEAEKLNNYWNQQPQHEPFEFRISGKLFDSYIINNTNHYLPTSKSSIGSLLSLPTDILNHHPQNSSHVPPSAVKKPIHRATDTNWITSIGTSATTSSISHPDDDRAPASYIQYPRYMGAPWRWGPLWRSGRRRARVNTDQSSVDDGSIIQRGHVRLWEMHRDMIS